jgi:GDP-4-dehydro-6-deoxy-D-mannose reductase
VALDASREPKSDGFHCDLLDSASVAACLQKTRPDLIINAAGSASVVASFDDPEASQAINADAVDRLLAVAAAETPDAHLLLLSSAQVYGQAERGELPFTEDSPLRPVTPYGETKVEMERAAERRSQGGAQVAVARLFNQLGPGLPEVQAASGFARQIAAAEAEGRERVTISVGNIDAARDFADVRDTAVALLALSRRRLLGTFNVCSGRPVELGAVIEVLDDETELTLGVEREPALRRPADPSISFGDPARLREAIGWQPQIPLRRSLADLLDSWRQRLADAA